MQQADRHVMLMGISQTQELLAEHCRLGMIQRKPQLRFRQLL